MDQYLGEIRLFGFNFPPVGWLACNGQTLAIQQYAALFSLLGTYYGGNGTTTFQLPNFQSRVPMHFGQGQGLSTYAMGQMGGQENVTLTMNQMPIHNHLIAASNANGANTNPAGMVIATPDNAAGVGLNSFNPSGTSPVTLAPSAVSPAGGSLPHNVQQPYLVVNFCIAYQGIFPSRA